jgi:DNA-binding beta-propeller fold protein YncE
MRAGVVIALVSCTLSPLASQAYHVTKTVTLGGSGGWDYLALDTAGNRLFIARQDRVLVVSPDSGTVLGEIDGLHGAHGVAFAYGAGHGFATSGRDSTVTIFDLKTLSVIRRTPVAKDDDAVLYDPATRRVFTFNGDARSASALDPETGDVVGTIDLGAAPEFGVSAGDGKLYVNLVDQGSVAEIDARAMRVTRRWAIAPCERPTGLALDRASHRLFSGCRNQVLAVSDAAAGKLVTTLPIGTGVDACRFDSATSLAFASNGEGTITIVREVTPDSFVVAATVPTRRGARTMELDRRNHRLFTVTADFGPSPEPTPEHPHPRPPILPGTFVLMILEP